RAIASPSSCLVIRDRPRTPRPAARSYSSFLLLPSTSTPPAVSPVLVVFGMAPPFRAGASACRRHYRTDPPQTDPELRNGRGRRGSGNGGGPAKNRGDRHDRGDRHGRGGLAVARDVGGASGVHH